MKLFWKYVAKEFISRVFFYFGGIFWLKQFLKKKNPLIILNYHNFSKYNNYKLKRGDILQTGYSKNFEKQIRFLKKHFNFCYSEEFFEEKYTRKRKRNVLLTFDDGYRDNYDIAVPILKKLNAKAIFFVSTKNIRSNDFFVHDKIRYLLQKGKLSNEYGELATNIYKGKLNYSKFNISTIDEDFIKSSPGKRVVLNERELTKIANMGFKIGNHTYEHIGLSFLKREEQKESIEKCTNDIFEITGHRVEHIAYPNGLYDQYTIDILKNSSIRYGYTIKSGINKRNDSRYKLRRIGVNVSDSIYLLILKISIHTVKSFYIH